MPKSRRSRRPVTTASQASRTVAGLVPACEPMHDEAQRPGDAVQGDVAVRRDDVVVAIFEMRASESGSADSG